MAYATLSADTGSRWGAGEVHDAVFIAEEAIYAGQFVQEGTAVGKCRDLQNDATAGFLGIALNGGAAGDRITVRMKGVWVGTVSDTIAAGEEGLAIYADSSGTANNNPKAMTQTSTNNLPVGKIIFIHTAGALDTNLVEVYFEADGFASR